MPTLPFKLNQDRRRHIPKQKHKVANWRACCDDHVNPGSTRRFKYAKPPKVIDLGLRLADIDGLETEMVSVSSKPKPRETLRRHGATEEEIEFLVSSSGLPSRRVELNALPSDQFIALIEAQAG